MLREDEELTSQVIKAQEESCVKGDFVPQAMSDLEYLHMSKDELFSRSDENLKCYLDDALNWVAYRDLIQIAKSHSKTNENLYSNMKGCSYFFDSRFTPDVSKVLFMFRTRMFGVRGLP